MIPALRRVLVPARDALRTHRRSASIIIAVLVLTGIAVIPVTTLADPSSPFAATRVALQPIPSAGLEAPGSLTTRPPHVTQQRASDALFRFALGSAIAIAALGLLTALTLGGARTADRLPEFAIRRAVGGSRRQLFASITLEGMVLTAGIAILATPVALFVSRMLQATWPGSWHPGIAALVSLTAGVVFGGAAVSLVVPYAAAPRPRLSGEVARPLSLLLPVAQMACSLIILIGGALAIRYAKGQSAQAIAQDAHGQVVSLESSAEGADRAAQYRTLLTRLLDSAGIESASLNSHGLRLGLGTVETVLTDCGDCAEGMIRTRLKPLLVTEHLASPDTFRALDIPVVAGRGFALSDDATAPLVAVVTRSLAERGFQYGEAIGRDLRVRTGGAGANPDGEWFKVVGIVEDYSGIGYGVGQQPRMGLFLSVLQRPPVQAELLLHGRSDSGRTLQLAATGTGLKVVESQDETNVVLAALAPTRWFGRIFAGLGWGMLLIGAVGSLVVMRTWLIALLPELGLRAAVGATRLRLAAMVLGRLVVAVVIAVLFAAWVAPGVRITLSMIVGSDVGSSDGLLLAFTALLTAGAVAGIAGPLYHAMSRVPAALMEHTAD